MKLKSLLILSGITVVGLYSQLSLADNWLLGIESGYATQRTIHESIICKVT